MNFQEYIIFAKIYNVANHLAPPETVSDAEVDIACEVLKRFADNSNMNEQQKELYKQMVEIANHNIKNEKHNRSQI